MFLAEDVEDGKQSDASVDETLSSVCHPNAKVISILFPSCKSAAMNIRE